jgi:hypothetical protein
MVLFQIFFFGGLETNTQNAASSISRELFCVVVASAIRRSKSWRPAATTLVMELCARHTQRREEHMRHASMVVHMSIVPMKNLSASFSTYSTKGMVHDNLE